MEGAIAPYTRLTQHMLRLIAKIARDRSGNALMVLGAALVPLTILIGSGLDLGRTYMARAKLQNACDAAVLAGRQNMTGTVWTASVSTEANRFFNFNFPAGTHGATELKFSISQDKVDTAQLIGTASAKVPTAIMGVFGFENLPISVHCDAKRDLGNNDVVLVLDVTGSMADAPSSGGGTKIARLRSGAIGIYRALQDGGNSVTRFGIVPYSHTVNVARSLRTTDILRNQLYINGTWTYKYCDSDGYYIWNCVNKTSTTMPVGGLSNGNKKYTYSIGFILSGTVTLSPTQSSWATANSITQSIDAFRTSGSGCIEERSSIGNLASPVTINSTITQADIDNAATSDTDAARQFGRYDPAKQKGQVQVGCPSEAKKLATYADEASFQSAINAATANVTGGTYHDIGMLWGTRFISSTGFFSASNPTSIGGVAVAKHIVFMTDGRLDTGTTLYSAHGVEQYQPRTLGTGTLNERHIARFQSVCERAKAMGVTIWVIALDVGNTNDIDDCATSAGHFFTSDGSDLQTVFAAIGKGIGRMRLTR